jgi:signal recognition particle subunit SRP54
MLKDICGALLASDVNVKLVQRLRTNIKAAVNVQDVGAGINKKRLVQKVKCAGAQQSNVLPHILTLLS